MFELYCLYHLLDGLGVYGWKPDELKICPTFSFMESFYNLLVINAVLPAFKYSQNAADGYHVLRLPAFLALYSRWFPRHQPYFRIDNDIKKLKHWETMPLHHNAKRHYLGIERLNSVKSRRCNCAHGGE